MSAPDLRLPPGLLADAITKATSLRVTGPYYRAVPSGYRLDLTLPKKAYPGYDSRASVPGIVHGLYLSSGPKTTMCEVWSPVKDGWQKKDLYSVAVDVSNIFDLRDMAATPWIMHDCFQRELGSSNLRKRGLKVWPVPRRSCGAAARPPAKS